MSDFELRPLARMGENAWKLIVYGLIIKFNAIAPSIEVPGLGTRPYLARARTSMHFLPNQWWGVLPFFFIKKWPELH